MPHDLTKIIELLKVGASHVCCLSYVISVQASKKTVEAQSHNTGLERKSGVQVLCT